MVILIPIDDNPTTGKSKFFSRLSREFVAQGHRVVHSPTNRHDIYLDRVKFRWKTDRPKILRLNGVYINSQNPYKKPNDGIRHYAKQADGIVYQSQFCKDMNERWTTYGLDKPNGVIFNGAPLVEKRSKLASLYSHTFVACARWRPHKRLDDIIEAFRIANIPSSELVVLGKAPQRCIPHVRYLGTVSQEVIEAFMANAVASVHIAYIDWCPNSVVEALACGCPVITNNVGGTQELTEHVVNIDNPYDGGLVRLYSPPKIQHHVVADALWQSMRWGSPKNDHVDIRNVAKQYLKFMESLL